MSTWMLPYPCTMRSRRGVRSGQHCSAFDVPLAAQSPCGTACLMPCQAVVLLWTGHSAWAVHVRH